MRGTTLAGLMLSVVLSGAAGAEVKQASANGFTSQNSLVVPVTPRFAWGALVDDVDRWWSKEHRWWGGEGRLAIEPRAGGCFCELAGQRQAEHLRVIFVDPDHVLRLRGGLGPLQETGMDGTLEFRLNPDGGGTRITVRYRVAGDGTDSAAKLAPAVDKVLAQQLASLAGYLRAGPMQTAP